MDTVQQTTATHSRKANGFDSDSIAARNNDKAISLPYAVSMHLMLSDQALDAMRGQHHESWQFAAAQKVLHMQAHALGVPARKSS